MGKGGRSRSLGRAIAFLGGGLGLWFAPVPAEAADPATLAGSCSGCHATSATLATTIPRIAGQPAEAIVEAMAAFAGGTRPATVMDRIAKGFTAEEVRAIAAVLAAQK